MRKNRKYFNVNGDCKPGMHYMVDLTGRLGLIKAMVDAGEYFTINRARQYGKTTTLRALADYLKNHYLVISLDFQRMSSADFETESSFVNGLSREILRRISLLGDVPDEIQKAFSRLADHCGPPGQEVRMAELFDCFHKWCGLSDWPHHL